MGRKHFKAEEIIQHLRTVELEAGKGLSLEEASRKVGVTPQTDLPLEKRTRVYAHLSKLRS
jgi:hypothetical protein